MANNTRKVGLKVEIDGENEYKQAINDLNKGNQVLASELRKVQEQYKGNEDSMEALRARSDVLQRQLQQQRDKVQTLRDALQNAATQVGEADKRTQEWQIKLNNAEREQIKLERALEETNKDIQNQGEASEEAGKKMVTLGDQVSGIADKFGIRLPESIKGALDHVDGFSTGTVAAMGAAAAGIGAVKLAIDGIQAGIQAVQKLNEMTLEQAHWADDLLTQSAQTGLSTTLLQQLDYASKFLDFDGIDKSLVKLTASMGQAATGAEKQAAAFQALGVSIYNENFELQDNWDVFLKVIDALGKVENATERDLWANQLFGKSYSELKPLIDAGSEGLEEFMQKAEEGGHVLDESQIQKLGEVDDAYQEYQTKLDDVKKQLALEFAPVSISVMEKFGDLAVDASQRLADSGLLEKIEDFIDPLGRILSSLGELMGDVLPLITPLVESLANAFEWLAGAAEKAVTWIQSAVDWGIEKVGEWVDRRQDAIYDPSSAAYNAAGTDYWRGGLTWVGESGPELVRLPQGTQIYSNQESRQIAAAGTDTRTLEGLLSEAVSLLEEIRAENQAAGMRRRMA